VCALGAQYVGPSTYGGVISICQMNAVEYALDIIEELRMQPEGLEYLIEYHVSSNPSTLLQ
jgi:hypothetical protein